MLGVCYKFYRFIFCVLCFFKLTVANCKVTHQIKQKIIIFLDDDRFFKQFIVKCFAPPHTHTWSTTTKHDHTADELFPKIYFTIETETLRGTNLAMFVLRDREHSPLITAAGITRACFESFPADSVSGTNVRLIFNSFVVRTDYRGASSKCCPFTMREEVTNWCYE